MGDANTDRGRDTPAMASARKQATVYDAVAGRVGYQSFLSGGQSSRHRDTASTSHVAVPPDEVLFRRKDAPVRLAENDVYSADRHLQPPQRLPDSDLLKAIHGYTADYYDRTSLEHVALDMRSMDETALLAIAVLLEEAATVALGKTGDLAFAERSGGCREDGPRGTYWQNGRPRRSVISRSLAQPGPHGVWPKRPEYCHGPIQRH
ncbi:hypothetical protein LTR53_006682 [Teratosphaeriaceae sp. CCFEE 6253]|nr:hypothetical protein LTR53_006682 [Teratosphaeriaceae sp. CCFEE 6253]